MRPLRTGWLLAVACVVTAVGCGGDGDGGNEPPPEDPLVVQRTPEASGNGQSGPVGEPLPEALRVVITRASEPQTGVSVVWSTADGGSLNPSTGATGADGIASSTWTLGSAAGQQTATATVTDAEGSPVTFTATAVEDEPPPPPPADVTIQVVNNQFDPVEVTIQAGQTVGWVWSPGASNHNVRPDATQPTTSGAPTNGPHEYRFTFTTAGTYLYHCAVHGAPGGVGMSGTVIVEP